MQNIIKKYNIGATKNNNVCLNDIVSNVIKSKNPVKYISKIGLGKKTLDNGKYYVDMDYCIQLLRNGKSVESKDFIKEYEKITIKDLKNAVKDNTIDIAKSLVDMKNNKLTYGGKCLEFIVVKNEIYIKGKELAEFLEYADSDQAIRKHVDEEDRFLLENLLKLDPVKLKGLKGNEKNTIYINESGLYSLCFSSKKTEAKKFRQWVTKEVLPSIRKTGSYHKVKLFYDENEISTFDNKNVIYCGYVGFYDGEHLYKFGKSIKVFSRDYKQHKLQFDEFEAMFIFECDNKDVVETLIKKELVVKNLIRQKNIKGKLQTELFTTTDLHNFDKIKDLFKKVIAENQLPSLREKDAKIKDLEYKLENDKDVVIEQERTKQKEEETKQKQKEIEYKLSDNYKLELQLKLAEINNTKASKPEKPPKPPKEPKPEKPPKPPKPEKVKKIKEKPIEPVPIIIPARPLIKRDTFGDFLEKFYEKSKGINVYHCDLYKKYKDETQNDISQRVLTKLMAEKGFKTKRKNDGTVFIDLCALKKVDEPKE